MGRGASASLRNLLMLCLLQAAWRAGAVREAHLTQPPKAVEVTYEQNNPPSFFRCVPWLVLEDGKVYARPLQLFWLISAFS